MACHEKRDGARRYRSSMRLYVRKSKKSPGRRFRISFSPLYVGGDARRNQPQFFNERKNNCENQNEIFDRNATIFIFVIDIIRRSGGQRPDVNRSQYNAAARTRRNSGTGGERSFLRGTRRRHTELQLPALRPKQAGLRESRRLCLVHAAGHVI